MRPVLAPAQLAGQLHALRLAARERGRALAQPDVAQADVDQGQEQAVEPRVRVEHGWASATVMSRTSAMRAAVVEDLERLAVVAAGRGTPRSCT